MTETPDQLGEQEPREHRPTTEPPAEESTRPTQRPSGQAPPGYGPPDYGPQGYGPPGQAPRGYGPPGQGSPGYGPPTYGSSPSYPTQTPGGPPAGYAPAGYGPSAYAPPSGYGPPSYGAPSGPPSHGAPGYGPPSGPPGFHTAPKPGIVPLRPLAFGDYFGGAFAYLRANPAATLLPAFVVAVVVQVIQTIVQGAMGVGRAPTGAQAVPAFLGRSATASGIVGLVAVVLGAILTGILLNVLRGAVLGRRTDLGTAWRAAQPKVPGLIGVSLLTFLVLAVTAVVGFGLTGVLGFAIGGGAGVAVGILLGVATLVAVVYLAVVLSLSTPAYVLEDVGVVAALNRSRALVRGTWWSVFGVLLVFIIMFAVVGAILGFVITAVGLATAGTSALTAAANPGIGVTIASAAVGVLITTFASPFLSGVTGLLYVDQRIRRERFDLDLARAAMG